MMITSINSQLWYDIWTSLCIMHQDRVETKHDLEQLFNELGIILERDADGRWENIMIPDDDWVLFALKHL